MVEILISGPGKNALSSALMGSLLSQLQAAGGAPLLLSGAGGVFCAGLDLKEVASLDLAGMGVFLTRIEALLEALYHYPGPTVALVNGHAIAGGCLLALACDYRIAPPDPKAKIGLNEVALGLKFPPRILNIVRRRLPAHLAERVVLEAGLYEPEAAKALGLIDEVSADAAGAARAKLAALAAHPAEAYAAAKAALRAPVAASPEEERYFRGVVLPSWTAPELKARVLAALKR